MAFWGGKKIWPGAWQVHSDPFWSCHCFGGSCPSPPGVRGSPKGLWLSGAASENPSQSTVRDFKIWLIWGVRHWLFYSRFPASKVEYPSSEGSGLSCNANAPVTASSSQRSLGPPSSAAALLNFLTISKDRFTAWGLLHSPLPPPGGDPVPGWQRLAARWHHPAPRWPLHLARWASEPREALGRCIDLTRRGSQATFRNIRNLPLVVKPNEFQKTFRHHCCQNVSTTQGWY